MSAISTREVNNLNESISRTLRDCFDPYLGHFREHCTMEAATGAERQAFDMPGGMNRMHEKTDRYGDVPVSETHGNRRWLSQRDFEGSEFYDGFDYLRALTHMDNHIIQSHVQGGKRKWDEVWVDSALGTAHIGKHGSDAISLPNTQVIPHGGQGMTPAKAQQAITWMRRLNNGMPIAPAIHQTSIQEWDLLQFNQNQSQDYIGTYTLDSFKLPSRYGCSWNLVDDFLDEENPTKRDANNMPVYDKTTATFDPVLPVRQEVIAGQTVNIRSCVVTVPGSVLMSELKPYTARVTDAVPTGKSLGTWRLTTGMSVGGVRVHEKKVLIIECVEDPINNMVARMSFGG